MIYPGFLQWGISKSYVAILKWFVNYTRRYAKWLYKWLLGAAHHSRDTHLPTSIYDDHYYILLPCSLLRECFGAQFTMIWRVKCLLRRWPWIHRNSYLGFFTYNIHISPDGIIITYESHILSPILFVHISIFGSIFIPFGHTIWVPPRFSKWPIWKGASRRRFGKQRGSWRARHGPLRFGFDFNGW